MKPFKCIFTILIGGLAFVLPLVLATMVQSPVFLTDTLDVDIGVTPCKESNIIRNCENENRVIAVAIFTTDDFDALTVNHKTVKFEVEAVETHLDEEGNPRRHELDVDGDGDIDLVFHFRLGDTELTCNSTEATLTGETSDGQYYIEGTTSIVMVKGGG